MPTPGRRALLHGLIGAWLGLSLATWAGAAFAFMTVERLTSPSWASPGAGDRWRQAMAATGDARATARYQAGETNRFMFAASARAQLVLAGLVVWVVARPPRFPTGTVVAVASAGLLVAVIAILVVPRAADVGRLLAFEPRPLPPDKEDAGATMERLHALYGIFDVTKAVLLLVAARASTPEVSPSPRG